MMKNRSVQNLAVMLTKRKLYWIAILLLPAFFVAFFIYYPVLHTIGLSLFSGRGAGLTFSGLNNFVHLFSDVIFADAFFNTLTFAIVQTPLMIVLSMILASALLRISPKIRTVLTVLLFLPFVVSPVVYSIFFKNLFFNDGILNNLLLAVGILDSPINWLLDPVSAKIIIVLTCTWAWSGYYILLFASAFNRINPSMIEAAKIDGISDFRILTRIKLPSILPVTFFCLLVGFANAVQIFAETMIITAGGPQNQTLSLMQYVYELCFVNFPQFGYAAAVSLITILLGVFLLSLQYIFGGLYEKQN